MLLHLCSWQPTNSVCILVCFVAILIIHWFHASLRRRPQRILLRRQLPSEGRLGCRQGKGWQIAAAGEAARLTLLLCFFFSFFPFISLTWDSSYFVHPRSVEILTRLMSLVNSKFNSSQFRSEEKQTFALLAAQNYFACDSFVCVLFIIRWKFLKKWSKLNLN